ncbi:N-acetylglucosamine kinase [Amycolatopsis sp. CA-230715]|uniref:N-acetylglucosamine kinase n=1 Tax=Amycolatopsis sp. CA-230715 TaxID=2745196 RepID=UPI001C3407C6|nr:BadF/BadG/BcrA/BcrD ATPase family protein [Amycolatopsis sp. CA-230715]QWF79116.1 N-acetylmuramic acid/N-acetylglucosamine kinase [Amycolatopsis sp. CA-230715]
MGLNSVIAIDGGNSKTDVLVVSADGAVLGKSRGPGASPQNIGVDACVEALESLVLEAMPVSSARRPFAVHTSAYLAGLDFPREEEVLHAALAARSWSDTLTVGNDTLALLRAGTTDGVGVAVVCGAGINCAGIGPDGATHRFPALGKISGDWGGGFRLGEEALWWAVRAEDGRGPGTALSSAVANEFGGTSVLDVVHRLHFDELPRAEIHRLCPLLFRVAATGDEVAQNVVGRFVEEVSVLVAVALRKLGLTAGTPEVVLGGGVLTGVAPSVISEVERRCLKVAPGAVVRVVEVAPVVGSALFGLDHLGVPSEVKTRLRALTVQTRQ